MEEQAAARRSKQVAKLVEAEPLNLDLQVEEVCWRKIKANIIVGKETM